MDTREHECDYSCIACLLYYIIIRYLCADTEHDLFIIIGAITHAKVMCHCVVLVPVCVRACVRLFICTCVCVHAYVCTYVPVCIPLCEHMCIMCVLCYLKDVHIHHDNVTCGM